MNDLQSILHSAYSAWLCLTFFKSIGSFIAMIACFYLAKPNKPTAFERLYSGNQIKDQWLIGGVIFFFLGFYFALQAAFYSCFPEVGAIKFMMK